MSLYERVAATPDGARGLAAARLRLACLGALQKAFLTSGMSETDLAKRARMPVRAVRRALYGSGNPDMTTFAELLHELGYEADVRLVPAGEPRRRKVGESAVPSSSRESD